MSKQPEADCDCFNCRTARGEEPLPSLALIHDKVLSEGKLLIGANGEKYKDVALSFALRLKEKYPDLAVEVFDLGRHPVEL